MLARLKGPFDVVPQLAYSKMSMKRLFIEKGPSNRANKVLEVCLWVSYIFGLKQKF